MKHAEITQARALYYGLLGLFLTYKRLDSQRAEAIAGLDNIASFPIIDDIINDARTLSGELSSNGASAIMQEFDDTFINGVNAKVVNLTASFYYEGQERGEKFLIVKEIVEQTPKRKDEAFVETEEHLGFLCTFQQYLLSDFENKKNLELAKRIFDEVINGYVNFVISEIHKRKNAKFYRHVARILEAFIEFERLYLEIGSPKKEEFKDISEELRKEMASKSKKRAKRKLDDEPQSGCELPEN